MTQIVMSVANIHKADVMLFNFEKNLLIEGTPLCYRKYLFGLFPSTVHIKPAVHSKPAKVPRREEPQDIFYDPFTVIEDNGLFDDDGMNMSENEEFDEALDEEFLNGDDYQDQDEPISEGDKEEAKEDDIMEGDIVVVSPLENNSSHSTKKVPLPYSSNTQPILIRYHSLTLPQIPETPKYKEKERRAVVVKIVKKDRVLSYGRFHT